MNTHHAEIKLHGGGFGGGTLVVDGHDLSNTTTGFTLAYDTENKAVLTVEHVLIDTDFEGEVRVTVPDATRAALVALGWTPPLDEEAPS